MACYFLAVMQVHDADQFALYQAETIKVLAPIEFQRIAVTTEFTVQEGRSDATDLVLLKFPDDTEFKKWWESSEYAAVKPLRENSAKVLLALTVDGA
jgi:uncharacterized protein (DUF1330 family)